MFSPSNNNDNDNNYNKNNNNNNNNNSNNNNEFFREKSIVAIRAKISLEFYLCITHSSVIILTNPEMNMK